MVIELGATLVPDVKSVNIHILQTALIFMRSAVETCCHKPYVHPGRLKPWLQCKPIVNKADFPVGMCLLSASVCACEDDPEVVGVLAQLATVDDTGLSEVLAATYRALLSVLVVQSSACTHRMNQLLTQAHQPVPDILSLSHSQPFK